jgi:hypothetical protein
MGRNKETPQSGPPIRRAENYAKVTIIEKSFRCYGIPGPGNAFDGSGGNIAKITGILAGAWSDYGAKIF